MVTQDLPCLALPCLLPSAFCLLPLPPALPCLLPLPIVVAFCLCLLPHCLCLLPLTISQILSNHSQAMFFITNLSRGNFGNFTSLTLLFTLFFHHFRKVFFNGISILLYDPINIVCNWREKLFYIMQVNNLSINCVYFPFKEIIYRGVVKTLSII